MKRLLLLLVMMQGGQLFCAAAGAAGAGAVSPEAKKIGTVGKALQNFADALNAYKVSGNDDQVKVMQQVIADVRLLGSITPDELEKALRDAQLSRSAARAVSGAGAAAAGAVPGGVARIDREIAIGLYPKEDYRGYPSVPPIGITPETTVYDVKQAVKSHFNGLLESGRISFDPVEDVALEIVSNDPSVTPDASGEKIVVLNKDHEKIVDIMGHHGVVRSVWGLPIFRARPKHVFGRY
jgi:hypothetical protein